MKRTNNKFLKILVVIVTLLFISFNNYTVAFASEQDLYLGGYVCGFSIDVQGSQVVALTEVVGDKGIVSPSKCAGLVVGDVIMSVNGQKISSSKDFSEILESYEGGYLIIEVMRGENRLFFDVFPEKDVVGSYKIGVFLRDDLQGIGTVTYVKEDGSFASLGHPVTDNNGKLIEINGGKVYNSSILGVLKGIRGRAGELKGIFIGDKDKGEVYKNTNAGMYGKFHNFNKEQAVKIERGVAHMGKATIFSTVDGDTPKYYDIEIVKTDFRKNNLKNLVIKVTDKELLEYTGGIVQGMSGSPIIQDGKLVGAVTHVFVNDSSRGFGIAIDNMLNN